MIDTFGARELSQATMSLEGSAGTPQRSQILIDFARAELMGCSTKLHIKSSTIVGSTASFKESACLRMFIKNSQTRDLVVCAPTLISASNKPFTT
jgi:hypothetical protein